MKGEVSLTEDYRFEQESIDKAKGTSIKDECWNKELFKKRHMKGQRTKESSLSK